MSIATEAALDALAAVIAAIPGLPELQRDRQLPGRFDDTVDGVGRWLCLRRGSNVSINQMLGTGGARNTAFEIDHVAELEWLCEGSDRDARLEAWRAGLEAIDDAIATAQTLGGVVNNCDIESAEFARLSSEGIPEIEAVVLNVRLTFTSNRPF